MKIANAPCSWGILEFGLDGETDDYKKMLDEMSSTGYYGTELGDWGFLPTDPNALKAELESRQLNLVGAFIPVNFKNPADHEHGLQTALKTARLLAQVHPGEASLVLSDDNCKNPVRAQNAGRIKKIHGMTSGEWDIFSNGVNRFAKEIKDETGLPVVFHHHCGGYVETPDEIRALLDRTDPDLVSLCFDTGHYAFGGGDPAEGFAEHSARIQHVHFKDFDPDIARKSEQNGWDYLKSVEKGIFPELGKGSVDFQRIYQMLRENNYNGWIVVEQDMLPGMGTPKDSAARNRQFLRKIGL
jgi:inosose dehydratase